LLKSSALIKKGIIFKNRTPQKAETTSLGQKQE